MRMNLGVNLIKYDWLALDYKDLTDLLKKLFL